MTVSLLELCLDVAGALDDVRAYPVAEATAGSGSVPGTVSAVGLGNQSPGASASTYDGAHAYVEDQPRRVVTGGYDPTFSRLTITPPFSSAPRVGSTLYVTRLFGIGSTGTFGEDGSYQQFVRRALRSLAYPDVLTLAITSSDRYDLSAYGAWLDRGERLLGIRESAPRAERMPVSADWRIPTLERHGRLVTLRLAAPFALGASGVLTLDVLRPPWTLVDGAESADGPTRDADVVEANPDDVLAVALMYALEALMYRQVSAPDGADWAARHEAQRAAAESLAAYDRTRMTPAPAAPTEAA